MSAAMGRPFYELFAGGGLASIGLRPDWRCAFANDIDATKARSYVANFGARELKVCDIANLTTADLPGHAELAWASPPCQDVSLAGDRAGLDGLRSNAFWPFWRLMQGLRSEGRAPKMVVIENVCGLITSHGGKDFDAICNKLAGADYRLGGLVIDAAMFVPQSRERVFIVAIDAALPIPAELVADRPSSPFHPPALVKACSRQRSEPIWWNLSVPPARNTVLADLIEDAPTDVSWHTQAATDRLIRMMAPLHLAKLDEAKRASIANHKRMIGGLYRRIRPGADGVKLQRAEIRFDDIAGCLRVPSGGSSRQTIVVVEGASVRSRLLSPREAARLMGLDDGYKLPGNYNDAYGLMGDGVGLDGVAGLIGIDPKGAVETMLATQMIGMHNAVADSLRMARESSELLRGLHLDHANRLSRTFAALVEAFERVRNKGRQTVVVQHVYRGGQAVGAVTK